MLTDPGARVLDVAQVVRRLTGLSLWRSKVLVDQAPVVILDGMPEETAETAVATLRDAGAQAEVRQKPEPPARRRNRRQGAHWWAVTSSCPGCCRGSWGSAFSLLMGRGLALLVVVVGRPWPLLSGLGRPRDGPGHGRTGAWRSPFSARDASGGRSRDHLFAQVGVV
ncbi:ribosomal protein L7/L12 [Streptomyces griseicoloratus]|uniref:ribosomal protein L7/L12 n=1 Tax=Streptomyces griseicoloratus TaxID=2752516 RepID=UPI00359C8902